MKNKISLSVILITFLMFFNSTRSMCKVKGQIWGIDISKYSGEIDWIKIKKSNPSFVFIRATEGLDLKDTSFDNFWLNLKKHKILRGAYHFYVTEDDPRKQADFFLSVVKFEKGDLRPVIDLETIGHGTKNGLLGRFKVFINIIENRLGIKPIIYTSPNFWDQHMSAEFSKYRLWIAEYGVKTPRIPKGWKHWSLWQYRENARLEGVEKDVDFTVLNSKHFKLKDLLIN